MKRYTLSVLALQHLTEVFHEGLGRNAEGLAALGETDLALYEPVAAQLEALAGRIRAALRYSPEQRRELRLLLREAPESNESQ